MKKSKTITVATPSKLEYQAVLAVAKTWGYKWNSGKNIDVEKDVIAWHKHCSRTFVELSKGRVFAGWGEPLGALSYGQFYDLFVAKSDRTIKRCLWALAAALVALFATILLL